MVSSLAAITMGVALLKMATPAASNVVQLAHYQIDMGVETVKNLELERQLGVLNEQLNQAKTANDQMQTQVGQLQADNAKLTTTINAQDQTLKLAARANIPVEYANPPKMELMPGTFWSTTQYVGEWTATAYSPTPDQTDSTPSINASGFLIKPGYSIAIDPRFWKLGTKFFVEGIGVVQADDTGSAIKGRNRLDWCVGDTGFADVFGMRTVKVWLIKQ